MAPLLYRLRSEFRRRWRAWLLPALLIGLTAGSAMAAASGARRTDTAYQRLLAESHAYDVVIGSGIPGLFDFAQLDLERVAALPEVDEAVPFRGVGMIGETESGEPFNSSVSTPFLGLDDRYLTTMNRPRYLEGGPPQEANELVVSFVAADELGLEVGDRVDIALAKREDLDVLFGPEGTGLEGEHGLELERFRIAGVIAAPGEFPPLSTADLPPVHFSALTARANPDAFGVEVVMVRLKPGTKSSFLAQVEEMSGDAAPFLFDQSENTVTVQRSLDVQAQALWLLAALVAAAGAVVAVQAIARQVGVEGGDSALLAAAGMTHRQLVALPLLRSALIAGLAVLTACGSAIALSPLTPIGMARRAEPDPGVWVDATVLALGVVAILVVSLGATAVSAARGVRHRRTAAPAPTGSRSVRGDLVGTGLPATVATGVRFALHRGSGATGVPVVSAVTGVAVGLATVLGALTFAAALHRLLTTPERYGWNWDVQIGDAFTTDFAQELAPQVADLDGVSDVAIGTDLQVDVEGKRVDVLAVEPFQGRVEPTLLEGEAAVREDEIVLGSRTMRDLGVDVGEDVTVAFAGRTADLEVVGRAVFPSIGGSGGLGRGGMMTADAARRLAPDLRTNVILVRGDDDGLDALAASAGPEVDEATYRPEAPSDLDNFARIDGLPAYIGAIMAAVALGCVAHALLTSVRRRRKDLAVLKSLGFVRSQICATVAWQATTLGIVALPVGLVLGVIGGRLAWLAFARQQGVADDASYPLVWMAVAAAGALVLVNLVAAAPAWMAGRTRPAVVFRSE